MTFSDKTLTLLVLIALGIGLLGVLFAIFAAGGSRKRREPGGPIRLDDALRGVLDGQSKKIDLLEQAVETENVTIGAEARDLTDGNRGDEGMVPEFLPAIDVGKVNLNHRQADRGNHVP